MCKGMWPVLEIFLKKCIYTDKIDNNTQSRLLTNGIKFILWFRKNKWDNHTIQHMKFNNQYQSKEWYIQITCAIKLYVILAHLAKNQ